MHVTYVPFIKAAGELKTKPTQQSVAKLREIGIAPHILVCRCEQPLDKELRQKISMFCNVPFEAVIEEKDVDHSIYEVPLMLQRERAGRSGLPPVASGHARRRTWRTGRKSSANSSRRNIACASASSANTSSLQDAYKSVYEAIIHGGIANDCGVEIVKVDAEEIEREGAEKILKGLGGILVPGGFGERGIEAKFMAAQYARENKIPYLGLCLGMQIATIEFARNVLKLAKAHSTEFDPNTPHPVIAMLDEQTHVTQKRRHHAPRRAALPVGRRHQGGATLRRVRHQRTPPPPLRIQQRLSRKIREGRLCFQRQFTRRQTRRSHRTGQTIRFSSRASSIPNSRASRTSRIRCSKASSPPRTSTSITSRCENRTS